MTEYEALQAAVNLCRELGEGWEPSVWHNLRWCYSAKRGNVSVHLTNGETMPFSPIYTAYYNPRSVRVGQGDTPQAAVDNLLELFLREKAILTAIVWDIQEVVS